MNCQREVFINLWLDIPLSFHCKHSIPTALFWTVNKIFGIIPFSLRQSRYAIYSKHPPDHCSMGVRQTAVDECWVVSIDQSSGGWQGLASLHASLGSIRLRFSLCRSGHCWILIPPSNIRPIDFFPEGCFCLHNNWIDFKQRGSSVCPRVHFFVKETALKIGLCFQLFFLCMQGHCNINTGIAKGVNLF